jgi:hypothetical protein
MAFQLSNFKLSRSAVSLKQTIGIHHDFLIEDQYCLSDEVITRDRVRKFSRQARQYLRMAYHAYDINQVVDEQTQHDCTMHGPVAAVDNLVNEFKTHHCALDFDYMFAKGT